MLTPGSWVRLPCPFFKRWPSSQGNQSDTAGVPLMHPLPSVEQSRGRASFLANLKISTKTAIVGGVGLLGLMLVGGVYFVATTLQSARQQLADEVASIGRLQSDVLNEMLQARRAEKDFLLRRDQKYVKGTSNNDWFSA